uniref:Uncharacterized protein n=1 Tax=Arion vulgaris TaxID=1028688 RepID=A0A0B6YD87_9EUPU
MWCSDSLQKTTIKNRCKNIALKTDGDSTLNVYLSVWIEGLHKLNMSHFNINFLT